MLLTSRVSVEMVQKTAAMGTPVMVAVSAPTALAVRTAEAAGITLGVKKCRSAKENTAIASVCGIGYPAAAAPVSAWETAAVYGAREVEAILWRIGHGVFG